MIKNWLSHRKPDLQINAIQVTIFRLHVLFYLGEFPLSHKPRHHFLNSLPSEGIEMMSGFTKSLPSPQNLAIFRLGGIHDFGGEFTPPPANYILGPLPPFKKGSFFIVFVALSPHYFKPNFISSSMTFFSKNKTEIFCLKKLLGAPVAPPPREKTWPYCGLSSNAFKMFWWVYSHTKG